MRTVDLTPCIGSEVECDAETLLSGRVAAELRELLFRRGVLVFRGLGFDIAQHEAFTATLGKLDPQGGRTSLKISWDRTVNGVAAEFMKSNIYWHIDMMFYDSPTLASCLLAHTVAPKGGETEFASTYAAWEDLPEADKRAIESLKVVHSIEAAAGYANPEPSLEMLKGWLQTPTKVHPLVWTHRSGRKSLVLGTSASHIVGMERGESRLLLCRLREWATQRQYVYQHRWAVGDIVLWDNTGTMHRVLPFDIGCDRLMTRTSLAGEEAPA